MDLGLGRIGQIALSAKDVDRSIAFYRDTLGLRLVMRPQPGMAFFDCGGQYLLLDRGEGGEPKAPAGSVLYFDVHDLALCVRELESRGVVFVHPPHRIAQMPAYDLWMAFLEDPDGHLLALQMHAPKGYAWPA